jgi:hypothetical protein
MWNQLIEGQFVANHALSISNEGIFTQEELSEHLL